MFRCRPLLAALLGLGLCAGAASARADIWWYIDAEGKSHVATEKVDDRYELFYKDPADVAAPDEAAAKPASDPALDALRETSFYKRISEHPNLERFRNLIDQYAQASGLDAALVKAVIAVESAFNPTAVSAKGALGLMQVIPETGERYGLAADKRRSVQQKLLDPETNLRIGTTYLRDLMAVFANDVTLVLAAYNAGEGTVARYANRVPPYRETQAYVKLVQQLYTLYQPAATDPVATTRARVHGRLPVLRQPS